MLHLKTNKNPEKSTTFGEISCSRNNFSKTESNKSMHHRRNTPLQTLNPPPLQLLRSWFNQPIIQIHHQNSRTRRPNTQRLKLNLRTQTKPKRRMHRVRFTIPKFCNTPTRLCKKPSLIVFNIVHHFGF
ncbi:hypothetical protein Hanom_Chr17g01570881 [Helianthus anomalus]